jgi:hypothetical protein
MMRYITSFFEISVFCVIALASRRFALTTIPIRIDICTFLRAWRDTAALGL